MQTRIEPEKLKAFLISLSSIVISSLDTSSSNKSIYLTDINLLMDEIFYKELLPHQRNLLDSNGELENHV